MGRVPFGWGGGHTIVNNSGGGAPSPLSVKIGQHSTTEKMTTFYCQNFARFFFFQSFQAFIFLLWGGGGGGDREGKVHPTPVSYTYDDFVS